MVLLAACVDNGLNKVQGEEAYQPKIEVSPELLDFGQAPAGEAQVATVQIRNVGEATLELAGAEISGTGVFMVAVEPVALAPGFGTSAVVTWTPSSAQDEAQLLVLSDDPESPSVIVPLEGEAIFEALVIEPDPYDIGAILPGDTLTGEVYVRNVGALPVQVDAVLALDAAWTATATPTELAPGDRMPVAITFSPPDWGVFETQLSVGNSAIPNPLYGTLVGEGSFTGVEGRVCDPSGNGYVVGATVTMPTDADGDGSLELVFRTETDREGWFRFEDVPDGSWVVHVEKGRYFVDIPVEVIGGVTEVVVEGCLDASGVNIVVVPGRYDTIEVLLDALGIPYTAVAEPSDLLADEDALGDVDAMFFDCGGPVRWAEDTDNLDALERWIDAGGGVYASDWAIPAVEGPFPSKLDQYGTDSLQGTKLGMNGELEAEVPSRELSTALGRAEAHIVFDLKRWNLLDGVGSGVEVLVVGDVPDPSVDDAPLAVRFGSGKGQVIYTSFHNEVQATEDMLAILEEFIYAL